MHDPFWELKRLKRYFSVIQYFFASSINSNKKTQASISIHTDPSAAS